MYEFSEIDEVAEAVDGFGGDLSWQDALALAKDLMPGEGYQVTHNFAEALVRRGRS